MSERAGQDSGHDYLTKAADELVLNESAQAYGDETKARELLQSWRWPHGPVCPHCQNAGEKAISKLKATRPAEPRPARLRHNFSRRDNESTSCCYG